MRIFTIGLSVFALSFVLFSCRKDKATPDTSFTNEKFFGFIKDSATASYYKNGTEFTTSSTSQFFHGSVFYKLRMNTTAFNACTDGGKLPAGSSFPDSSLLIKEIRAAAGGSISEFAAMYKLNGSWNWARFKPSGEVLFGIDDDEVATCVGCHQPQSRDLVRSFDEHP
jgi:hypothetical protein